jgi:hypothetical protein
VDDWRGARGHVQFTAGDGHGEKNEVPDGWKDLFETDDESGDDGRDEAEADESDPSPSKSEESESGDSGGSDDGRLRRALFEDVRALWGGDR